MIQIYKIIKLRRGDKDWYYGEWWQRASTGMETGGAVLLLTFHNIYSMHAARLSCRLQSSSPSLLSFSSSDQEILTRIKNWPYNEHSATSQLYTSSCNIIQYNRIDLYVLSVLHFTWLITYKYMHVKYWNICYIYIYQALKMVKLLDSYWWPLSRKCLPTTSCQLFLINFIHAGRCFQSNTYGCDVIDVNWEIIKHYIIRSKY